MNTLRITPENRAQYENTELKFSGRIEIASGMGTVRFTSLSSTLSIVAEAGSGIKAGKVLRLNVRSKVALTG